MAAPGTTPAGAGEDTTGGGPVVLDTSALVTDPDAVQGFAHRRVVLPLRVIEELDGLKHRQDHRGWAARRAVHNIELLRVRNGGDLREEVALPDGGSARVEPNGVHLEELRREGLDTDTSDNRVIAAAVGVAAQTGAPRSTVTLVSNDVALRLKAAHFGLQAIEHVRHAPAEEFGAGWRHLAVAPEVVDRLYRGELDAEELTASQSTPTEPLRENEFVLLDTGGSQSGLGRVRGGRVAALGGQEPSAWGQRPRSLEQRFALELLLDPDVSVVALSGMAGTGKTLLAVAAGLEQVVEHGRFSRAQVYRPSVPMGEGELGYLPGALEEKLAPWMNAIVDNVDAMAGDEQRGGGVVDHLLSSGALSFESIGHARGRSLTSSWVLVDEAQNLEASVAKSMLTRIGEGSKVVVTGDPSQIDSPYLSPHNNALAAVISGFVGQRQFGHVDLRQGQRSEVAELAAELL